MKETDSLCEIGEKLPHVPIGYTPRRTIPGPRLFDRISGDMEGYQPEDLKMATRDKESICPFIPIEDSEVNELYIDPNEFSFLNVETKSGYFTHREVRIYQYVVNSNNDNINVTNIQIELRLNKSGPEPVGYEFTSIGNTKNLNLKIRPWTMEFWKKDFWKPNPCGRARIDIHIPVFQQNNDIKNSTITGTENRIPSFYFDECNVNVIPPTWNYNLNDANAYLASSINITTKNGDIQLWDPMVESALLKTLENGNIKGYVRKISDYLVVNATYGDISVNINEVPKNDGNNSSSSIELFSNTGDIVAYLNNSFIGAFNLTAGLGDVVFVNSTQSSIILSGPNVSAAVL
ncbi:7384_t:CDS:2 [Ambispora leptoticha]|uniref:7384_t:CDS:1 n=1 Tax=Ambispora leptoticha TaxID=144679 RepID=A0A9N9B5S6_9GLOM|nr:7384_t:CDS:2 [Ambispora leptoticha]